MIACPKCRTLQPPARINTGRLAPCPGCTALVRADLFPAFLRRNDAGETARQVREHGQAECFFHPGKAAVEPCQACGRLLCPVCRVDLDGRTLCMSCLKAGRDKQKISTLNHRRMCYDNIALALALWPVMTVFGIFFTFLTAPAAIFFAVRHWRSPAAVLPKTWLKSVFALLAAGAQVIGWAILLIATLG